MCLTHLSRVPKDIAKAAQIGHHPAADAAESVIQRCQQLATLMLDKALLTSRLHGTSLSHEAISELRRKKVRLRELQQFAQDPTGAGAMGGELICSICSPGFSHTSEKFSKMLWLCGSFYHLSQL